MLLDIFFAHTYIHLPASVLYTPFVLAAAAFPDTLVDATMAGFIGTQVYDVMTERCGNSETSLPKES